MGSIVSINLIDEIQPTVMGYRSVFNRDVGDLAQFSNKFLKNIKDVRAYKSIICVAKKEYSFHSQRRFPCHYLNKNRVRPLKDYICHVLGPARHQAIIPAKSSAPRHGNINNKSYTKAAPGRRLSGVAAGAV